MSCAKPVNKVDPLPWANPTDVKVSPQRLEAIAPAMQTYVDRGVVSGITTLVARHGKLVHWESTGFRDLETQDPLEPNDIFRIYSMTKPVTAVAIMMLVEEGTLAIDGELSSYLPDFADVLVYENGKQVPPEQPVTIRHLLSHTSGMTYGLFGNTPVDAMYRETNVLSTSGDLADLADKVARLPLLAHPGTVWNYSVSADILGRVIEVISGLSFDDFLHEKIFEPLDMQDTGFFVPPEKASRFVTSYTRSSNGSLTVGDPMTESAYDTRPTLLSGSHGLVSTARDFARFAQMLLNGGELDGKQLLRPGTVEMMRTNVLPQSLIPIRIGFWQAPGYGFGLGFSVLTSQEKTPEPDNNGTFRWWGIGSTYFWIDPIDDVVGIVMAQLNPPMAGRMEQDFQTLVYEALQN